MKIVIVLFALVSISWAMLLSGPCKSEYDALLKFSSSPDTLLVLPDVVDGGCFTLGASVKKSDSGFILTAGQEHPEYYLLRFYDGKTQATTSPSGVGFLGRDMNSATPFSEKDGIAIMEWGASDWEHVFGFSQNVFLRDGGETFISGGDTTWHLRLSNGTLRGFHRGRFEDGFKFSERGKIVPGKGFVKDGQSCFKNRQPDGCGFQDSINFEACRDYSDGKCVGKSRAWIDGDLVSVGVLNSQCEYHGWSKEKTCGNSWKWKCYIDGREYEPEVCAKMEKW